MGTTDAGQKQTAETALSEFIATTTYADLPDDVIPTIQRAFIDTVGVTLAGATAASGDRLAAFHERNGSPTARFLAPDATNSVTDTALAVGTAAHALDYDDLSWAMDGHPSIVLIPPILALAEHTPVSGTDAITAYAVGYEVACSIAAQISPEHYETGWHASATFGTFGATAAAASLLDLDPAQATTALNIAASMPAGTKRNFGSMTKPLHAGLASRSGVTAAQLAADGFTSGRDAVSGPQGFWDLYGPSLDDPQPVDTDTWYLADHGIHVKRYPCCYFTHAAIAATQDLTSDHQIDPATVEHVDVHAAGGAIDALSYTHPDTELEAKFSMQHAIAVALTQDRIVLDAFEPAMVEHDTIRSLYDRITLHHDDTQEYDSHAARVEIDLGTTQHATTRDHPPWVHEQPPGTAALREKFFDCATRAVDSDRAERLYDRVANLPNATLTNLLSETDDPSA